MFHFFKNLKLTLFSELAIWAEVFVLLQPGKVHLSLPNLAELNWGDSVWNGYSFYFIF